jgi:hypothetical protein
MPKRAADLWRATAGIRGTQLIFSDIGVNPTAWGFCVYDEVVKNLVKNGVPREQIAVIGEADTDAKKQTLFEKVRNGTIRFLIGSTSKMGTGTNVQKRLVGKHDLDAPWKPAEVEQRDGRAQRQGNINEEVSLDRYVTEGSFDAYMWQALETKARFIAQIMTGESGVRRAEDVGGQELSYAEVKAIASGNPAVLVLAEADAELQRLGVLRRSHMDEQYLAKKNQRELPQTIERFDKRFASLTADMKTVAGGDPNSIIIGGRGVAQNDIVAVLTNALDRIPDQVMNTRQIPLGRYCGLTFGVERYPGGGVDVYLEGQGIRRDQLSRNSQGARAVLNAPTRITASYDDVCQSIRRDRSLAAQQFADYQARLGKPFAHAKYLDELTVLRDRLKIALSETPKEGEPTAAELADQIKVLKAAHVVDAAPTRLSAVKSEAPKPVSEEPKEEPAKAEEPPPSDDDGKPAISFRVRTGRGGTQQTLF